MGYRYQTSLPAYHSILGDLSLKQEAVWIALYESGEMTDQQLAAYLHWPINCVTPRRGELEEMRLVVEAGTKIGETHRPCTIWKAILREPRPKITVYEILAGKQIQMAFA